MNNLLIKIKNVSRNELIRILFINNIDVEIVNETKEYIMCKINIIDLANIKKIYNIEIIDEKSLNKFIINIKNKLYIVLLLIISINLFYFLSNIIVKINILSDNSTLVKNLSKSLDNNDIKRFTLKKDFIALDNIKEKLLDEYKNDIEWLEIENVGMTYNIKLEERKNNNIQKDEGNCNIIATSDGIISKIISTHGEVLVKNNQIVKEGDILISGKIMLNEENRANICAKGLVFAEKWYNVTIDIPSKIKKKKYTNKFRYNLEIEYDNRDFKIFKSRLINYDVDRKEIISLLGKKINLLKEYEYIDEENEFNEETLNERVNELITEKLELNLHDDERILDKKVLKKEVNDSRIKIEMFVTVEKQIGKQVTYALE